MAIKPNAYNCTIKEQIINDLVAGLTFQFESVGEGQSTLRIFGDILPLGNREINFDKDGNEVGSGTAMTGPCRTTWLQEVME